MVDLRPFQALRPPRDLAATISAPPYDVMNLDEARALASGNPNSFLHVSRPEIDLPDDVNPHDARVYQQGRRALTDFVARGILILDDTAGYLVYRQRWRDRSQTGIVGCVAVSDYEAGAIRTHEHTRPDKERDRVRHIDALAAHDEPVFLFTLRSDAVETVVEQVTASPPTYDFTSDDEVVHTLWTIQDPWQVNTLRSGFDAVDRLYVADGHHRSAAAATVHRARAARRRARIAASTGSPGVPPAIAPSTAQSTAQSTAPPFRPDTPTDAKDASFLAVVFPSDQLQILAYNRVVADLAGQTPQDLLDAMAKAFEITPTGRNPVTPDRRHDIGLYLAVSPATPTDTQWFRLRARAEIVDETDPVGRLDVTLLQDQVLAPLLGINDPRTDARIQFVSGIRGTAELVRLVDSGAAAVAFSLCATSVEDLLTVADTSNAMPPKSTWFEPKLRSGLFVHSLDTLGSSQPTPVPDGLA